MLFREEVLLVSRIQRREEVLFGCSVLLFKKDVLLFGCSAVLLLVSRIQRREDKRCCSAVLLFCCSAVLLFCCSAVLLFCCFAVQTRDAVLLFREYLAFLFLTTNNVIEQKNTLLVWCFFFFLKQNLVFFSLLKQNLVFFSLSS